MNTVPLTRAELREKALRADRIIAEAKAKDAAVSTK